MTAPQHYSRDIAQRCKRLIENLWPSVKQGFPDDAQFGGTFSTTFLLAIATPMIVLPIERIFRPASERADQVGDDRQIGPARAFGAAPFVEPGRWSYVPEYPKFNIADEWPPKVLGSLAAPEAQTAADHAPARQILLDLRNALAQGGVAYLEANGRLGCAAALARRARKAGPVRGLLSLRCESVSVGVRLSES
jgi:hypothetical protein